MKKVLFFISFIFFFSSAEAQNTFMIEEGIRYPDLKIRISDSERYPDVKIRIGKGVRYSDFSIGISDRKSNADFIITNSRYPDYKIRVSSNERYPDLKIRASSDERYPDIKIDVKESGRVDYLIYSENLSPSLGDIVAAILPAINQHTDFKHRSLRNVFGE